MIPTTDAAERAGAGKPFMKEADIRPQEIFNRYLELCQADVEHFFGDRSLFIEVPCPACGGEKRSKGFAKMGFSYVVCGDCGSLYASPRPRPEGLESFYRDGESVRFWSTDFFRKTAEARRERMFRPRAQLVSELLDRHGFKGSLAFADVGSGYGIFLEEIRRLGRFERVMGIEPGPDLAEIGRRKGFAVIEKSAESVSDGECQADVVTAFEVLEHVFAPAEFLAGVKRCLKPGGVVLLTTLTASGFDIQVLWERSKSVHAPHHINLLSVAGVRRLFERAGLALVELATPGQLDVDIIANAVAEDPSLRLPAFLRAILAGGEASRREFQEFLSRNALSSHLRAVAVRR